MGPIDENETKSAADVENEYIHLADCFLGLGARFLYLKLYPSSEV